MPHKNAYLFILLLDKFWLPVSKWQIEYLVNECISSLPGNCVKMCRKHVLLSLKCLSVDLINTTTYNWTKIRCWHKLCFFAFVKWLLYVLIATCFLNLTFVKVMQNLSKCIKRTHKISKDALGSVLLNWTQDAFNELLCQKLNQTRKKPAPFQVS